MKIKRFEASSMSDALRMIKKEFGEDAVILSAKTMKKGGGLLGNKRPHKVVVTAAVDNAPVSEPGLMAEDMNEKKDPGLSTAPESHHTTYSKFSFLKKYQPITRTGKNKVKPKIVQLMTETAESGAPKSVEEQLLSQGVTQKNSTALSAHVSSLLASGQSSVREKRSALSQAMDAIHLARPMGLNNGNTPRIVVMVGPAGVGKTCAVAKLAGKHIMDSGEIVGIISLDNKRIAGSSELERYATIMGCPFETACNAVEAEQALQSFAAANLVVVDTPALGIEEHYPLQTLKKCLSEFQNAEIHLLLSAATQEKVMARAISFFSALNIDFLAFTKLDWAMEAGPMINQAMVSKIPISYLCDSHKVPEGLHPANSAELSALLLPEADISEGVPENRVPTVSQQKTAYETTRYVANKNSDIFHHNSCKSVNRINAGNMMMFKDPAEAMGQNFKPCRMCCGELIVKKPLERLARRYAGGRC